MTELRRLKMLEDENARLKRVVADLTLDRQILQEVDKKALKPAKRRELARWMQERFRISVKQSCRLALLQRSTWYRKSRARDQSALRMRIRDVAMNRPRSGYPRIHVMLRREGWRVSRNKVYRLYRLEGLQLRMKVKRRSGSVSPCGSSPTGMRSTWPVRVYEHVHLVVE